MKNKNIFALLFSILFIGGFIYVFQKLKNTPEVQENKINEYDNLADGSINREIPNFSIYNLEEKKYQLKDLLNCKYKVILNISNCRCLPCIEYIFSYIDKYKSKIGSNNIMVLVDFPTNKEFLFFVSDYDIKLQVFNTYGQSLGLPVDSLHIPYFLVVDSTLQSIDVFVPNENLPIRTDHFLIKITDSYF